MPQKEKFDYFLIPYERHTLYTKLKEPEMEKGFNERPSSHSLHSMMFAMDENYKGDFYANNFSISKVMKYSSLLHSGEDTVKKSLLIAKGTIESIERTKLIVTIQVRQPLILLSLMLPALAAMTLTATGLYIIIAGFTPERLVLLMLLTVFYLFFTINFKRVSKLLLYDIQKMFEAAEINQ